MIVLYEGSSRENAWRYLMSVLGSGKYTGLKMRGFGRRWRVTAERAKNPRRRRSNAAMGYRGSRGAKLIPAKLKRMSNGRYKVFVAPGAVARMHMNRVRNPMDLHDRLLHAATVYDEQQSHKRGYNMYALPQYMAAIDEAMGDIKKGADVRATLTDYFSGPLRTRLLKAARV